jgi:hypothetical protein
MTKMARAGVNHGNTAFIRSSNHLIVTHAAAWLNHTSSACIYDHIQTISEGEESITGHRRVL